jgi:hypothetical protein
MNILLFKPKKWDQNRGKIFEYYANTEFNNLDNLIDKKYIKVYMQNDTTILGLKINNKFLSFVIA